MENDLLFELGWLKIPAMAHWHTAEEETTHNARIKKGYVPDSEPQKDHFMINGEI